MTMNAMIFDRNAAMRELLIEVLSWFGRIESISLAETERQFARMQEEVVFDLILIGDIDDQEGLLGRLRGKTPAQLVAYRPFDAAAFERLHTAGADMVFDAGLSIWKIGLLLRPIFWSDQEPLLFCPRDPGDGRAGQLR